MAFSVVFEITLLSKKGLQTYQVPITMQLPGLTPDLLEKRLWVETRNLHLNQLLWRI